MSLVLRPAKLEDSPAIGRITFEAFTRIAKAHGFPPDFPNADLPAGIYSHAIQADSAFVIVAQFDDTIVGANILWENNPIAGIGPLSVDPKFQSESVGRKLMQAAVERAQENEFSGVRLVQSLFNCQSTALYTKLGFELVEPLTVFYGNTKSSSVSGHSVRSATIEDTSDCNNLCTRIHGHDRPGDLDDAIRQGSASVVQRNGKITGYATQIGYMGHAVGETNEDIKALIANSNEIFGPGFHVPSRNHNLMQWCLSEGLRIRQPMALMKTGIYHEPKGAYIPSIIF